jgi:hypothetical protein
MAIRLRFDAKRVECEAVCAFRAGIRELPTGFEAFTLELVVSKTETGCLAATPAGARQFRRRLLEVAAFQPRLLTSPGNAVAAR